MIFFTADTHFGHANIIRYCERPYNNVYLMDADLIERWNNNVGPNDTVYHLGDFALTRLEHALRVREQLNGKIVLVAGGHDKRLLRHKDFQKCFEHITKYEEIKVQDSETDTTILLVLCHYALEVWEKSHFGSFHLHGHSHGNMRVAKNRLDVGVDTNGFAPLSYQQVKDIFTRRMMIDSQIAEGLGRK